MAITNDSAVPNPDFVRVTFDPKADAAYIKLASFGPGEAVVQIIVEGIPNLADIVLDFSSDGQLLGMEIVGARAVLSPELLASANPPPPSHKPNLGR